MLNMKYSVNYDYDSYTCDGCYGCDTGDDYCRGSRFEGLRITGVNMLSAAEDFASHLGYEVNDVELAEIAKILSDSDLEGNLDIFGEADYYGDEVAVYILNEHNFTAKVRAYFESKSDSKDTSGVLDYVRATGHIVSNGTSPLDALKTALRESNNGMEVDAVENATSVALVRLTLNNVDINEQHFKRIQVSTGIKPPKNIVGVVVKNGKHSELVDGYHRLKSALAAGKKTGYFFELS